MNSEWHNLERKYSSPYVRGALKSGGPREKHAETTANLGISSHLLEDRGKPRKPLAAWNMCK
jgi:hypothetical protein